MKVITKLLIAFFFSLILAGCSKIYGVVTSNDDGTYQSVSVGGSKASALKSADNDAKVWCKRQDGSGKYVVMNQEVVQNKAPEVDTGSKLGNAIAQVATYADSLDRDDDFEATTQFRCSN